MLLDTAGEFRAIAVPERNDPQQGLYVSHVVTRNVLAIELGSSSKPRLVNIPAQSLVEIKHSPSAAGLLHVIWKNKAHLIFQVDLTRLKAEPNDGNRPAHLSGTITPASL